VRLATDQDADKMVVRYLTISTSQGAKCKAGPLVVVTTLSLPTPLTVSGTTVLWGGVGHRECGMVTLGTVRGASSPGSRFHIKAHVCAAFK